MISYESSCPKTGRARLKTAIDYKQEKYKNGEFITRQYYAAVNLKVRELGYDTYARAFVVSRPKDLKKSVNFFAPKFNKAQVDRLLKSKRFKMIPQTIHEQMTDKTIKIE